MHNGEGGGVYIIKNDLCLNRYDGVMIFFMIDAKYDLTKTRESNVLLFTKLFKDGFADKI